MILVAKCLDKNGKELLIEGEADSQLSFCRKYLLKVIGFCSNDFLWIDTFDLFVHFAKHNQDFTIIEICEKKVVWCNSG